MSKKLLVVAICGALLIALPLSAAPSSGPAAAQTTISASAEQDTLVRAFLRLIGIELPPPMDTPPPPPPDDPDGDEECPEGETCNRGISPIG